MPRAHNALALSSLLVQIGMYVVRVEDAAWWRARGAVPLACSDFQKTRKAVWNRPFFMYTLL